LAGALGNSGGPPPGGFDQLDEATWDRAIQGTLLGAVRLIRAALPHLRHSERPAILVILSSSAREPIPGLTASNTIRPGLAAAPPPPPPPQRPPALPRAPLGARAGADPRSHGLEHDPPGARRTDQVD